MAAEAAIAKAGLNLLLANSDVDQTRQDSYLDLFDEARAAGLLLAPLDGPLTTAHRVQGHGRPVILVNAPAIDDAACSVVTNDKLGGRLAAEHLVSQGFTRLAFVGGPLQLRAVSHRLQGSSGSPLEPACPSAWSKPTASRSRQVAEPPNNC